MNKNAEAALAIVQKAGLSQFQQATESELRALLDGVNDELKELQDKMRDLRKQRTIIEMLYYVMYPQEEDNNSYHGASFAVGQRLSRLRGDRGENKIKAVCSVEGCKLDVMAKGFCEEHYHQNKRANLAPPLKDGSTADKLTDVPMCIIEGCVCKAKTNDGLCQGHSVARNQNEFNESTGTFRNHFQCINGCGIKPVAQGRCPKCYQQYLREKKDREPIVIADPKDLPDGVKASACCGASTTEGEPNEKGNRYCDECGLPCYWKEIGKKLPVSWSCPTEGCKSQFAFRDGRCKKCWDAASRPEPTPEEQEVLAEIRSSDDNSPLNDGE